MGHDLDDQELKATRKLLGLDRNKSIEEDIKKLENLIVTLPNFHLGGGDSIERILQDYKRQKQINEEHRKVNGELREKVKELEIDLTTVYLKGVEDGKEKYKQKIKDEIEELKNLLKTCNKKTDIDRIKAINERILELQELLGEE